jgi:uncharacterized Zn-finger protein
MNKNNILKGNTFLIIILVVIAILLFINILLYIKNNVYESFSNLGSESEESNNVKTSTNNINNINLGLSFQSGISGINPTGTITFQKPFLEAPVVITQIIGSISTSQNVYSIQIFNVTNTGFNYSKNMVYNNVQKKDENLDNAYLIPTVDRSMTESFLWVAFR